MSPVSVKVGGAWKTATAVYTRIGGVWKTATDMPVRIGGVWKTGILATPSAYELIESVTVGAGGAASVTFSSIPSTYKHLQIRAIARSDYANSGYGHILARFNSDSGSNYVQYHILSGDGSSASSASGGTGNRAFLGIPGPSANDTANVFMGTVVDILDYANTSKNKTTRSLSGSDFNGSGRVCLISTMWMSTDAISTILLYPYEGNWVQNVSFSLYGIK